MRARALLLSLAPLLAGCGAAEAPSSRVVLIGVDGLEPSIVAELIAAGRMPHLAGLAKRGVLGELETLTPTYSPVIWTTVATGQGMDAHGIVEFLDEATEKPFTSNCRKVPALWNLVSEAGRTVDVVGWWISWPAEVVDGRVVASYAAAGQYHVVWKQNLWKDLEGQTFPPGLAADIEPLALWVQDHEDLKDRFWEVYPRPDRELHDPLARCVQDLMWTFAGDESFAAIAEHFLAEEPGDLVMAYLAAPDVAGHRFWRYHAPEDFGYEVDPVDLAEFGGFLHRSYEAFDERLGRLLAQVPADATVIVLSDHGMHANPDTKHLPDAVTSGHHQLLPPTPGIIAMAGPSVKPQGSRLGEEDARVGHVLDVAPLVLHLMDVPVPRHWPRAQPGANELETLLDDLWRAENPVRLGANPDPAFRSATPPLVPVPGSEGNFRDWLVGLGYVSAGSDDDDDDEDEEP